MSKKEKFVKIHDLSVSNVLLSFFVNKELLPGTKISKIIFGKDLISPYMYWLKKIKN